MPRRRISEYRAKILVSEALGSDYVGWSVQNTDDTKYIEGFSRYVVKVDQATKGRFKKGLVALNVPKVRLSSIVKQYAAQGYSYCIVEPYVPHDSSSERYVMLSQERQGVRLAYSSLGGVDIESNPESVRSVYVSGDIDWRQLAKETALSVVQLQALVQVFKYNHFVFLEINPYVATDSTVSLLDVAVEVDDAGQSLAGTWTSTDIREPKKTVRSEEEAVRLLDRGSVASFNLSVINPEGSIFLLLSGGGASVVIADEIYNRGLGAELANYGEYSGNPKAHEAQKYTSEVLKLLLASHAPRKVLFIGGAVANFTDIATTFAGVIAAIDEHADALKANEVKVYVRRGGPRQELGLENIRKALDHHGLLGGVYSPSVTINDALGFALEGFRI